MWFFRLDESLESEKGHGIHNWQYERASDHLEEVLVQDRSGGEEEASSE